MQKVPGAVMMGFVEGDAAALTLISWRLYHC